MKKQINAYGILCIIALLVIAILECNTNNNPTTFLLRLLPPYHKENGYFFYGNLLVIILIPIILSVLYKETNWKMLNSTIKRVIWTFIFLTGCGNLSEASIQFIKSFQNDLDAIYIEREHMSMTYEWETIGEKEQNYVLYNGEAYITLKNCSKTIPQEFKVKLNLEEWSDEAIPEVIQQAVSESEVFHLEPRETKKIKVCTLDDLKGPVGQQEGIAGWSTYNISKVTLYNDEVSVEFIKAYA